MCVSLRTLMLALRLYSTVLYNSVYGTERYRAGAAKQLRLTVEGRGS